MCGSSAGVVAIRLVNAGKEPHFLRLALLPDGKTAADYNAARLAMKPFPAKAVASPMIALPGDSTEVMVALSPGRYVGLCMYPAPNRRAHADLGMIGELDVEPATTRAALEPAAEDTLHIRDDAFALSSALRRGTHVLSIENDGSRSHSAYILRVPAGSTPDAEIALFLQGPFAERANRPLQGLYDIAPGVHAATRVTLEPGSYVLVSRLSDYRGTRTEPGLVLPFSIDDSSRTRKQ